MTLHPQPERCCITQQEFNDIMDLLQYWTTSYRDGCSEKERMWLQQIVDLIGEIRSRPTQSAPPTPNIPTSKELTSLAEHDWHNREERKHKHPMSPWVSGWITGFLTEGKPDWNKEREEKVRKELLDHLINWFRISDDDTEHEPWSYKQIKRCIEDFDKEVSRQEGLKK